MKPIIRAHIPLADRKRLDFVQGILGKYGLTRWRRQFQSLILRKFPLSLTEPAAKPSDVIVNNISSHTEKHIYHSIYHPVMQTLTLQKSPNLMLKIIRSSPGSLSVLQPNESGDKGDSKLIYSSPHPTEALEERVREHRGSEQNRLAGSYPPLHSGLREPQALKDLSLSAIRHPEGTRDFRRSVPPLKSALADRAAEAKHGTASELQLQQFKLPRLRQFGADNAPQHVPAAYRQLQALRIYSLIRDPKASSAAQVLVLNQEVQAAPPEKAERSGLTGPPLLALKPITKEAVSGSAGIAVGTQHSTPSTAFVPSPGLQFSPGPSLKLALGRRIEAALEHMEAAPSQREAQQHKSVVAPKLLPLWKGRMILQLPVPQEPQELHKLQELRGPQAAAVRYTSALLNSARLTEAYGRYANVLKSGRRITAAPEQEDSLQLPDRPRSLILRKPEPGAAMASTPEQTHTGDVLREQAVQPPAHFPVQAKAPATKLDAAELNQLAERVYQVLEKRIAIRKDRRGLR
ncbi:hypothetical protein [Paenibacillus sp. HW567]|uniref:hypothetical protein n=1 Tax=Paenibacillus sp. HW567 TaxID=1034769 RepID=UPI00037714CF|nr:hypothetical protein [Paenibacillus sp. HW567]